MTISSMPAREVISGTPDGWRIVTLGKLCDINPARPRNLQRSDDAQTTFVPMAAVDDRRGIIATPRTRPFSELRKGYTYFGENDVLFAKITPCMQNGKHAIARGLTDGVGFASTEFHVVRPGSQILPEWVHFFLRQPVVLEAATRTFTGTVGQQRVPEDFLEALPIPLPPIDEQHRIAAKLDGAFSSINQATTAAKDAISMSRVLPYAYVQQYFPSPGDPAPTGWTWVPLGEVCDFLDSRRVPVNETERRLRIYGKAASELYPYYGANGQVGWIDDFLFDEPLILLAEDGGAFGSSEVPVAYAVAGKYWVNNHAHVLRPRDGFDFDFCLHALRLRPDIGAVVTGNTRPKLNQKLAAGLPFPVPLIDEQRRIAKVLNQQLKEAGAIQSALKNQLDSLTHLRAAFLREAFSGRL